jgi:hypothetical protein
MTPRVHCMHIAALLTKALRVIAAVPICCSLQAFNRLVAALTGTVWRIGAQEDINSSSTNNQQQQQEAKQRSSEKQQGTQ